MTSLKSSQKVDVNFAKKTATVVTKPGQSLVAKDVTTALKKAGFGVDKFAEVKPVKAKPAKKDKKGEKGQKKGDGSILVNISGMT